MICNVAKKKLCVHHVHVMFIMDFVSFCVFDPEIGREKVSFVFVMIAAAFSDSDLL